ncbi:MAG: molecular chaperone DnaK [Betaproteobacteria bacterium HGW-Betaproteobacteria-10]|nr:MAG: molecular chaperone DnaK [Betaproteobacteria bacterium HGW-Betaproteobacteria-10]
MPEASILATCHQRLQDELVQTHNAIAQAEASCGVVELDQSSVGRVSRIDAMQQQALGKATQARLIQRLRKLTAAINRLEANTYGECCDCGADIEAPRLNADPATPFCAECAAERER